VSPDDYLGRVRAVAWLASGYLRAEQLEEVNELIEHGEPAEGLCSLAWAIVNMRAPVPAELINSIYEYTAELIDADHMPPNLHEYADSGGRSGELSR
jgi:hypothetical protein